MKHGASKTDRMDAGPSPADVVIAFDLDNTLLDADGRAYERTVSEFLSFADLGLDPAERVRRYEEIRSFGHVLERLGLDSPFHDRGCADGLAVLCLVHGKSPALCRDLGIDRADQLRHRGVLRQLAAVDRAATQGPPGPRLSWEMAARRYSVADPRVERFAAEARRVAAHPIIRGWADAYEQIEHSRPVDNVLPLMDSLVARGFSLVIITEGRSDVQIGKLRRVGLASLLEERILVTEAAAKVPGLTELDDAISRLMEVAMGTPEPTHDPQLSLLWYFRCLVDAWSSKTPEFYARCLHAIQDRPSDPQRALDRLVCVPAHAWRDRPLRFVMVGDRYDKDVKPLIELLGRNVGLKIRLRLGKYAHLQPEDDLPPDQRPDLTFTDWDSLASFLTDEMSIDRINPITCPPKLVRGADVRIDYLERGLRSSYEAVRAVAEAAAVGIESSRPACDYHGSKS